MRCLFLFLIYTLFVTNVNGGGNKGIGGVWITPTATMHLEVYQEYILNGWYSLLPLPGTYMLNGLLGNGGVLCFGVVWQNGINDTESVTTWNGFYDAENNTIQTHWVTMTLPISITRGSEIYVKNKIYK